MALLSHEHELVRSAWATYAARLQDLQGEEYERAEQDAWDELQDALSEAAGGSPRPSERIE